MSGIGGFIDYLPDGRPYIGLLVETDLAKIQVFLATKENANAVVKSLTEQLNQMAQDVRKMDPKIVPVPSVILDTLDNHKPSRRR